MNEFFEWFGGNYYKGIISVVSIVGGIGSILLIEYRKRITRENLKSISAAFNVIVAGLSSKSLEVRMSSAILLRRFLDPQSEYGVGGIPFAKSTVSVIAAILKTLKTSDFQKVMADSLRFAPSESMKDGDFQRANLSKAYLGGKKVCIEGADFYQANLSGTSFRDAKLNKVVFYEATLESTVFRNTSLRGANFRSAILNKIDFRNADLTDAVFDEARLRDVDFSGAILTGAKGLNVIGYNVKNSPDWVQPPEKNATDNRNIFISRVGITDTRQSMVVNGVKDLIKESGWSCVELRRDIYDATNVLSSLSKKVASCSAMVVFGFRSMHVIEGVYRYNTEDSRAVKNEFVSTPWNHIEVGMAVVHNIPVLLLVDEGIDDGAFHGSINDELLVKLPIDRCLDVKNSNVAAWLKSLSA